MGGWSKDTAVPGAGNAPGEAEPAVPAFSAAQADRDVLAWRISRLRRYDLNLVLSLHALLHTRNVTQAGDWLGVTQPAMSSDLPPLRQMLKDELLVRWARIPADRPRRLAGRASQSRRGRDRTRPDLATDFDPAVDSRSFSIAMSDHVMALFLPALAVRLPVKRRSHGSCPWAVRVEHYPVAAPTRRSGPERRSFQGFPQSCVKCSTRIAGCAP